MLLGKGMTRIFSFFILTILLISGCSENQPTDSSREVAQGQVIGIEGNNNTYAWKGIPFAKPPLGDLRWKPPVEANDWEGLLEANSFASSCFQRTSSLDSESEEEWSGSEDCLYLNVWTPNFSKEEIVNMDKKLPVMMWVHGGGNTVGSAAMYDPSLLVDTHNVIVVTVQYRMGPLGWFRHPSLFNDGSSQEERSGNFGTLDNIMALKWINKNVEQFGGDSNNVTIFGESAGAHNVTALYASPLAQGLFHRAISESGIVSDSSIEASESYLPEEGIASSISALEVFNKILIANDLAKDEESAKVLQDSMTPLQKKSLLISQSPEVILRASSDSRPKRGGMTRAYPDGHVVLRGGIQEAFTNKEFKKVPIIFGTNKDETKFFNAMNRNFVKWGPASGLFKLVTDEMPTEIIDLDYYQALSFYGTAFWKHRAVDNPSSQLTASGHKDTFAYRFDWDELATVNDMDLSLLIGSAHALEILFVMGTMEGRLFKSFLYGEGAYPAAKKLSNQIQSYWAEFAYMGNPGRGRDGNLPEWSSWSLGEGNKYLVLDSENDQGVYMSDIEYTKDYLLSRLIKDDRLDEMQKCEVLYGLSYGDGNGVTKKEFNRFWDGRCANKDYTNLLNLIENDSLEEDLSSQRKDN